MSPTTLLDGGMGHCLKERLEAAGLASRTFLSAALANAQHAELVTRLHGEYVAAGAQVLTTNTFSVTPLALQRAAWGAERLEELARHAADCAADAALPGVRVAACLPPLADCYGEAPVDKSGAAQDEVYSVYLRLATALSSRCQLALVETMARSEDAALAARAARCAGLDCVWLSFTLEDGAGSPRLRGGESLSDALRCCGPASAYLVNCCDCAAADTGLPVLRAHAAPLGACWGAQPNAFLRSTSEWLRGEGAERDGVMDPQAFAAWGAAAAAAAGDGCVLGGCCGTTPEHIAALNAALLARNTS